uniref:Uncharacterized protein n=1 Tax=Rousettus aegyptiacus TaxID=9407 RepID=A0A7J8KAG3_ROUAE|nr:hypothetical protein HJG63_007721 [Rousettus aegyptiacus]
MLLQFPVRQEERETTLEAKGSWARAGPEPGPRRVLAPPPSVRSAPFSLQDEWASPDPTRLLLLCTPDPREPTCCSPTAPSPWASCDLRQRLRRWEPGPSREASPSAAWPRRVPPLLCLCQLGRSQAHVLHTASLPRPPEAGAPPVPMGWWRGHSVILEHPEGLPTVFTPHQSLEAAGLANSRSCLTDRGTETLRRGLAHGLLGQLLEPTPSLPVQKGLSPRAFLEPRPPPELGVCGRA